MNLAFLSADPQGAGQPARSPLADARGGLLETRDGWEVAVSFADPGAERAACTRSVGVADVSQLGKLQVDGPAAELTLGQAEQRDGCWWCPITPERSLVLAAPAVTRGTREALGERSVVDLTSSLAAIAIAGPLARETIARFCALDLRESRVGIGAFLPGSIARTPGFVLHDAPERFVLLIGAAYGRYAWEVVTDAATRLGGQPVGVDALVAGVGVAQHA